MTDPDNVKVLFMPKGCLAEVSRNMIVTEATVASGCDISAPCGGHGTCGKCRIRVLTGDFTAVRINSEITALSPVTSVEERLLSVDELNSGIRLACQARLTNDAALEILMAGATNGQIISKSVACVQTELKSAIKVFKLSGFIKDITLPPGQLCEMLQKDLTQHYNLPKLDFSAVLTRNQPQNKSQEDLYVWVRHNCEVLALRPYSTALGAAVDIGTTTIALYLCDLTTGDILQSKSLLNPQSRHGADVISRISYQYDNPAKLKEMQDEVIVGINELLVEACAVAGYTSDDVADMVVAGNTFMLHLFFGISPDTIGVRPFLPAFTEALCRHARTLRIKTNPAAYVQSLPSLAGFVGADVMADIVALQEQVQTQENLLLLDIGTNGEIVLKKGREFWAAACATGPALEGAHIACGVRAAVGAVEHVQIAPETFALKVKFIGHNEWISPDKNSPVNVLGICGSGIIDLVSQLYLAGILQTSGRFVKQMEIPRLEHSAANGSRFVLFAANENMTGQEIYFTQADMRAVQTAKGALYGGCQLLMQKAAVDKVDKVFLSGAFGQHIDAVSAYNIGLFPVPTPSKAEFAGNSAGHGAIAALLNVDMRELARVFSRKIKYVELSEEKGFNSVFMAGMPFPGHRKTESSQA